MDEQKQLSARPMVSKVSLGTANDLARQVLDELGREGLASYMETRIGEVADPNLKFSLVVAYARLKGPDAAPLLMQLIADKSQRDDIRAIALRWLAHMGPNVGLEPVITELSDPKADMRRAAAEAASAFDDARVIAALINATRDADTQVQAAAVSALITLNAREATGDLAEYLRRNPSSPEAERSRIFLAAAEHATVLSNLPALPMIVIDRGEYTATVVRALRETPKRLVIIVGTGGSGKSTVANLVARAVESEYKLWVPPDRCENELLARSLASLVQEGRGEEQIDSRRERSVDFYVQQLLRAIQLDGRRFMFIIDGLDQISNDADAQSAIALLNRVIDASPNARAIVTSRPIPLHTRVADAEIRYVEIDRLSLNESIAMIHSVVSNLSEAKTRRLAELAEGNPLILQLLAERLREAEEYSFASLEAMLTGYRPESLWQEALSHLANGIDPTSLLVLQAIASCNGELWLNENVLGTLASEGIDDPTQIFDQLASRGLVVRTDRRVLLSYVGMLESIKSTIELHDQWRLSDKFRWRIRPADGSFEALLQIGEYHNKNSYGTGLYDEW